MTYLANIAHIDPLAFPQRQSRLHEHFGVRRRPGGLQRRAGANSVALGWNRMSDEQVLKQLTIKQGVRFFTYRWEDSQSRPPARPAGGRARPQRLYVEFQPHERRHRQRRLRAGVCDGGGGGAVGARVASLTRRA